MTHRETITLGTVDASTEHEFEFATALGAGDRVLCIAHGSMDDGTPTEPDIQWGDLRDIGDGGKVGVVTTDDGVGGVLFNDGTTDFSDVLLYVYDLP